MSEPGIRGRAPLLLPALLPELSDERPRQAQAIIHRECEVLVGLVGILASPRRGDQCGDPLTLPDAIPKCLIGNAAMEQGQGFGW